MKIQFSFLIFFIFTTNNFCQGKAYAFDLFNVQIENSKLEVFNSTKKLIFEKEFSNPKDISLDLDGDGINEYLIIDEKPDNKRFFCTLYIFNTIDSFYIADSILSGYFEPYPTVSDEVGGVVIITGNPKFDSLNGSSKETFLPIRCWKYDNGEVYPVNDELYNIFIAENDTLLDYIDSYFNLNNADCNSAQKMAAAIAAVYANYIYAGDKTLASQFLKKYYNCDDIEKFKQKITELL